MIEVVRIVLLVVDREGTVSAAVVVVVGLAIKHTTYGVIHISVFVSL